MSEKSYKIRVVELEAEVELLREDLATSDEHTDFLMLIIESNDKILEEVMSRNWYQRLFNL